ncbi:hypothetical protein OAC91_00885 [Candidatus Marinimicrobia bacterium]|nr:hypothetical protein [Candidatus Neomarinimicrobiota bacterium]
MEILNAILHQAFEDGISHWLTRVTIIKPGDSEPELIADRVMNNGTLGLYPYLDMKPTELTLDKVKKGLQLWLKDQDLNEILVEKIEPSNADEIIQFSLFGKVKYK